MNVNSLRVPSPTRSRVPGRRLGLLSLGAAALLLASCATLAPGADPAVVNAERVLKVAPAVYDGAMSFAHSGVPLPTTAANALERFRTGFPPLYRTADGALATYKATKAGNLTEAITALELALVNANATVVACGGPALLGGAK